MDTNFVGQMSIIVSNALFMSVRLSFFLSIFLSYAHSNGHDFSLAKQFLQVKIGWKTKQKKMLHFDSVATFDTYSE